MKKISPFLTILLLITVVALTYALYNAKRENASKPSIERPGELFVSKRVKRIAEGIEHDADSRESALEVKKNDKLQYTVNVFNNSSETIRDVFVRDILPPGLELLKNKSRRNASLVIKTLEPGKAAYYIIKAAVTEERNDIYIENVATARIKDRFADQNSAFIKIVQEKPQNKDKEPTILALK